MNTSPFYLPTVGSVVTMRRSLETRRGKLPVNWWVFGWTHDMLVAHAERMQSLAPFKAKVLPRVADRAGAVA